MNNYTPTCIYDSITIIFALEYIKTSIIYVTGNCFYPGSALLEATAT